MPPLLLLLLLLCGTRCHGGHIVDQRNYFVSYLL
jgi:hypothetical protein